MGKAEKYPIPTILFSARMDAKNGSSNGTYFTENIESGILSKCRYCSQGCDPKMRCARCNSAAYCRKMCQKAAWKEGHKVVCTSLPMLNKLSKEECAKCSRPKLKSMCRGCMKACYCGPEC
jgi:hypothetical protein